MVRGSGDVGSAVAYLLFKAGRAVVIHDSAEPSATRRKMAFCDAVFDGETILEDVRAKLINDIPQIFTALQNRDVVPLTTLDLALILAGLKPAVLVDARMRKHFQPEVQTALAPFTVGLGPNFVAGETVDAAIETGWNEGLGNVIWNGPTRPLEGEPQTIAGHARDRYVYAPAAGIFRTLLEIGSLVTAGQQLATIGDVPLHAPISGMLRGLTRDGVPVSVKTKVIEVDPRGAQSRVTGIAERPGKIANGVLQAIETWENCAHREN